MGSIKDWLPSLRSTEHQMGALSRILLHQVRLGRGWGGKGRYFSCGLFMAW